MNTFIRNVVIAFVLSGALFSYPVAAIQETTPVDIDLLNLDHKEILNQIPTSIENSAEDVFASCWIFDGYQWIYICHQGDNTVVNS